MQVYTLASGSSGNCTLVQTDRAAVLIDAGISTKRIVTALAQLGLAPEALSGIFITHEHSDHIGGLSTFIKHYNVPIFAPRTVANHISWAIAGVEDFLTVLVPGEEYALADFGVTPFRTPHDTPESVGYRVEADGAAFGLCTDLGHVTDEVLSAMRGVDAAVIESNHDLEMLRTGPYPVPLKRRILSDNGHLSNDAAAELALTLTESGTRQLVLGHLSRQNNLPPLARKVTAQALESAGADLGGDVSLAVAPEKEILHIEVKAGAPC